MASLSVSPRRLGRTLLLALILHVLRGCDAASGEPPGIFYVYDDLNRLIAVIDQDGNAATYTYDAVGNLLKIERIDAASIPGRVVITLVSPNRGKAGTAVEIFGSGFSNTPAQNSVSFNGTSAAVTAASPSRIVTTVPSGAPSGRIMVTSPLGSATSPTAFTVPGAVTVSPAAVTLFVRRTQQFTATDAGNPIASVSWSVNGVLGGSSAGGTISLDGLYTAPATVPSPSTVTVTATNRDDERLVGSASVTLVTAPDIFLVAPAVSVQPATPAGTVTGVTTSVSVTLGAGAQFLTARPATVAVGPVITAIAPATAARATNNLAVTLTGVGLSGATALGFSLGSAVDANITVTNLLASADGTQVTATVAIAAGAAVGPRAVQISTPAGTSTPLATGGNAFTVQ